MFKNGENVPNSVTESTQLARLKKAKFHAIHAKTILS